MASLRNLLSRLVLLGAFVSPSMACETFDPPPEGSLVGVTNGIMAREPDAPIVLALSETFERGSLRFKLVRAVMDADRNLLDEQSPPLPDEFRDTIVVAYDDKRPGDPEASFGGTVDVKGRFVTITPDKALGYAVPYLLLIEPGLKDLAGNVTIPRQRLPFSYALPAGGSTVFPTGYYYFLINVELLSTQIQAAWCDVTGVSYARHEKPGRPPSLRVTYECGLARHSEWVCFQHTGYPREKAVGWWRRRAPHLPVPSSVDEALAASDALRQPVAIQVRPTGQYTEITAARFG